MEWQKEIQEMQANIAVVRAERDAEEKQKRELEARLKSLYEDFVSKMSNRLEELQATQGRFAAQHNLEALENDQRMQMLIGLQVDLAAAMGAPAMPAPPLLAYSQPRQHIPMSLPPSTKLHYGQHHY